MTGVFPLTEWLNRVRLFPNFPLSLELYGYIVLHTLKFETTTDQAIEAVLASLGILGIDKIEESEVF